MIKYQLCCDRNHEFEGWFQNSVAFDEQRAAGLLTCPVCGVSAVRRALMTPNLSSPKTRKSPASLPADPAPAGAALSAPAAAQGMPPAAVEKMHELVMEMRQLQSKIKSECRDVGNDFAEEARKIHYGEVEPEGIYGQASPEEREALDEEGIEIVNIPWLPPEN